MTQEEILLATDDKINAVYLQRLYKLRADIKSIEARFKKKNKSLSKNQQLIKFNEDSNKYGFIYNKNNCEKYKLILFKDINSDGVLSVYKIDKIQSKDGANSPKD